MGTQNCCDQGESDCLIKPQLTGMSRLAPLWVIPAQCYVCEMKRNLLQARVNGGSNYDSLQVAKCLVIQLVTCMNGSSRFPLSLATTQRTSSQGNGLELRLRGKKNLLSLTLVCLCREETLGVALGGRQH